MTSYPPEPWFLGGELLVSAFRVPVRELPSSVFAHVPDDHRPLVVAGHATLGVAFAHYVEGGALAYEELLMALPVVGPRGSVRQSIPAIWVTSAASRAGGRALWGIPKDLADFTRDVSPPGGGRGRRVRTTMGLDGAEVATLDARVGPRLLPGTPHVPLPTAQLLDGRRVVSRNSVYTRIHALRTTWRFAPGGPLGHLAGRTPLLSAALADASIVFGRSVERG